MKRKYLKVTEIKTLPTGFALVLADGTELVVIRVSDAYSGAVRVGEGSDDRSEMSVHVLKANELPRRGGGNIAF